MKGPEGAKISKTSQASVTGEEEWNQKETNNIYELIRGKKESTNGKPETVEEEKGTEKGKGRKTSEDEV